MEQRDRSRVTDPRVIVAIDELADLVQTGGPAILESLGRLVQRGREAGIHVIGATQKPSSADHRAAGESELPGEAGGTRRKR